MPDAVYIDFECLKTKPPAPMLLGILSDVGGRRSLVQIVVSASLKRIRARPPKVQHATLEDAVRTVVDIAESADCPIVGWSLFDHDVILRADVSAALKAVVHRRYVNGLGTARPWKTKVYPAVKIARAHAHAAKNTLDAFAALAGYRHVDVLQAGEPAKWIRRSIGGTGGDEWRRLLAYNAHDLDALRAVWTKASAELATWNAYERASYYVDTDRRRPIRFKPGATSARLDALIRRRGVSTWAFMTAWNPGSIRKTREVNDAAQATLVREIDAAPYPWVTGRGASDDGSWPPEESVLILGISPRKARRLGRRFGQFAFVIGRAGAPATLVSCAVAPRSP